MTALDAMDLPGMDLASLSYPRVASRTRFVLDGDGWWRAGLGQDDEAMEWLAELERGTPGSVVVAELVSEGVIRFRRLINTIWGPDVRWTACACGTRSSCRECGWRWLTVRRRYTGPVPCQVLAAFRPEVQQ